MTLVRVIIEDAFRKVGVVAHDEPMTADYAAHGLRELNRMLKGWQNYGHNLWAVTLMTVPLIASEDEYDLDPRPQRIQSVRFKDGDITMTMQPMTRGEWDDIPVKVSLGIPTSYYYDRQKDTGELHIWPQIESVDDEVLRITYEREFDDQDNLNVPPDSPIEWEDCVVHNLAARLGSDYGVDNQKVDAIAVALLQQALAADREGSVYFYETPPW